MPEQRLCIYCLHELHRYYSAYESRIVTARHQLINNSSRNKYIEKVKQHEDQKLLRVGKGLLQSFEIPDNLQQKATNAGKAYVAKYLERKYQSFLEKPLHGYTWKAVDTNPEIDVPTTRAWLTNKYINSHFEAYACAIEEQEIGTKDIIYRRQKLHNQQPINDNRCRLCKQHVEESDTHYPSLKGMFQIFVILKMAYKLVE